MQHDDGRRVDAVVFDLGGVLIDWNPRYLYRTLFDDEGAMELFLRDVCSPAWIGIVDAGRPFATAVEELTQTHPDQRSLIEAFHARWPEMLGEAVEGTVGVLGELRAAGVPVYGLSNWSSETFPVAEGRYPFLRLLDGILISGEAGHSKPAREIFEVFLERFQLHAERCVFVDDREENVSMAAEVGFDAVRFESPEELRAGLIRRALLAADLETPMDDARRPRLAQ
jgi:2-haloacid dehalogenase